MTDIYELNRKRAEAAETLSNLAQMNTPTKYEERMAANAAYRLALDASTRAEADYREAMNRLSTDELIALTKIGEPARIDTPLTQQLQADVNKIYGSKT
jgi:hypothetical protein